MQPFDPISFIDFVAEDDEHKWSKPNRRFAESDLERRIYERLGPHPSIVEYHGVDDSYKLALRRMKNGSLAQYLMKNPRPDFSIRAQWAIDICRGVAHLHNAGVLWADCAPQNVLLSDDAQHALICDFGNSAIWPSVYYRPTYGPPPPFILPFNAANHPDMGNNRWSLDLYALTGLVFFLLSWRFPCAPVPGPNPWSSIQELFELCARLDQLEFDSLDPARFGAKIWEVVNNGFNARFADGAEFANALEVALADHATQLKQGLLPDPDTLIPEYERPERVDDGGEGSPAEVTQQLTEH